MKTFRKDYKRVVWGYVQVKAENKAEANKKYKKGDADFVDNKFKDDFADGWVEE
jgi:hypothetical protein